MGIINKFKQFVSNEALGDETIETVVSSYMKAQNRQPHEEPHNWLASAWLHRIKSSGKNNNDETVHMMAFNETFLHACVKPPLCARSLGLFFLYKENPHIVEKYPKYINDYNSLIGPVMEAE